MTCIVCHNKQSLKKRFPFKILDKTEETYPSSEEIFIETKNETFSGLKAERKDMSRWDPKNISSKKILIEKMLKLFSLNYFLMNSALHAEKQFL